MDKPWYQSKTIWTAILFVAVAVLKFYLPGALPYSEIVLALSALGLWGLRDAQGNLIVAAGKKRK